MSSAVGIVRTDDILAGKPRIEGTRISVRQVGVCIRELEWSREEVGEQFGLDDAEIQAALEYYDDHPREMERLERAETDTIERIQEQSRAPE